jgi:hypothetical protein
MSKCEFISSLVASFHVQINTKMAKLTFVSSTTTLFAALTLLPPLFILPDLSNILTKGLQRPKGKKVSAFGLIATILTEDMFVTIGLR